MKKKLIVTLITVCTFVLLFSALSALAVSQTETPVAFMAPDNSGLLWLDDFSVTDVEAFPDYQNLRIHIYTEFDTSYLGYYNVDLAVYPIRCICIYRI